MYPYERLKPFDLLSKCLASAASSDILAIYICRYRNIHEFCSTHILRYAGSDISARCSALLDALDALEALDALDALNALGALDVGF